MQNRRSGKGSLRNAFHAKSQWQVEITLVKGRRMCTRKGKWHAWEDPEKENRVSEGKNSVMKLDFVIQPFSFYVYISQENIYSYIKNLDLNVHNSSVSNIPKLETI